MKGRVVKGVGGSYQVSDGVCSLECSPRGRLKREDRLAVGDWVEVSEQGGEGVVERVYPRRNALVRPFLANVDQMLLLITSSPMADLLLIDKLLVLCAMQEIPVYLAINKQDINPPGFCERIFSDYRDACGGLLELSALCGGRPEELTALLSGKLTCLAGQSAVGKSTLLNLWPVWTSRREISVRRSSEGGIRPGIRRSLRSVKTPLWLIRQASPAWSLSLTRGSCGNTILTLRASMTAAVTEAVRIGRNRSAPCGRPVSAESSPPVGMNATRFCWNSLKKVGSAASKRDKGERRRKNTM